VAFAYDLYNYVIEATRRGIELALAEEVTPYVIVIPNGKDPAECLQKDPAIWQAAYDDRKPYMQWLIDHITGGRMLSPEEKKKAARELVDWLAKVQSPTEQADWLPKIAANLQTSEANIRELFTRLHPQQKLGASMDQEVVHSSMSLSSLGEVALAILLTFPEAYPALIPQIPTLKLAGSTPLLDKILPLLENIPTGTAMDHHINNQLGDTARKALALKTEELLRPYGDIDLTPSWAVTELSLILQRIRSEARDQSKTRIAQEINRAQQLGDTNKVKELFQELQNLI
jgi:DNA primase